MFTIWIDKCPKKELLKEIKTTWETALKPDRLLDVGSGKTIIYTNSNAFVKITAFQKLFDGTNRNSNKSAFYRIIWIS
jgi:hypothetical protein